MKSFVRLLSIVLALAPLSADARAQGEADLLVRVKRLYVGDGTFKDDVAIVIRNGKFESVGPLKEGVAAKETFDAEGLYATPGFVEGSSFVGLPRGADENEEGSETTPELDVRAGLDLSDPEFALLLDVGVTTVVVVPGYRNVFGGLSAAFKPKPKGPPRLLRAGVASQAVAHRAPTAGNSPPGRGFFRGGGPDLFNRRPNTRMGVVHELRRGLQEGRGVASTEGWRRLYPKATGDALARAVKGETPFLFSASDVLAALRIADEFGVSKFYVQDAGEAHLVAAKLAERKVGVLIGPIDARFRAESEEERSGVMTAPKILDAAGATYGISRGTSDDASSLRAFLTYAVRGGLTPEKAAAAVTGRPAAITGLSDATGVVAPGLDADLLLFDGDPTSPSSTLAVVVSDGAVVRRSEARK
jgi:imidazolonepropionase-like amidohydrolase